MVGVELMKNVDKPLPAAQVDTLRRGLVPNVINVHDTRELRNDFAGLCVKDHDGRGISKHGE
jgi:hypothetical protein